MAGQQPAPVNDAVAPASVTVVLFGDMFAPTVATGEKGTVAYATGVTVDTTILAQKMISVELAHLQAIGAIAVEPFLRKLVSALGMAGVNIRITDEQALRSPPPPARIARAIAEDKKSWQDGANVRTIISRAYSESVNPYKTVVQLALGDAVDLGYLKLEREPGLRGIAGALVGHATTIPIMERIQALQPAAEALAAEWNAFSEGNADAAEQLQEFVTIGLDYCREGGGYY